MEPTYTEYINKLLEQEKPVEMDTIKEYIDKHEYTAISMNQGEDYYFKRNKIVRRDIEKYTNDGQKVIDEDATNNKLASGWHKLLVDQKVGYLVGDPVTIGYKEEEDISTLTVILGEDFDDTLTELVKNASNKGTEWLHPYIDEDGEFQYIIISAQEGIPIYDRTPQKNLIAFIRFYPLDHDDIVKVEFWDKKTVTYYEIINGKIVIDVNEEINPRAHIDYGNSTASDGYGWEMVPFINFKNNEEEVSDLTFYKDTIDLYDILMSDTANTLEDVQQFLYEIVGYDGEDLDHAVTNLKRYKGVAVTEGGAVNIKQGQVPMDSIGSYLDRLRETIYQEGQGVDVGTDKFGNSPSGIALKFLFSLLDMKANVLERKFIKALRTFMWFVCEYARMTNQGNFDNKKVSFTFNKSMLMNDQETVNMAQQSMGVISKQTIMENHPWVSDAQLEKERLEEEEEGEVDLDKPIDPIVPVEGEEDE
ncbi:phage portal protein [Paraliobacillus sediminis]|uniref:phage portal protein n=1 Tax=Paraliobacillus sediminis TaxID=1885916 RepID=UPI0013C36AF6|nr:phage portal protein [Paraliobacillus sediminis]